LEAAHRDSLSRCFVIDDEIALINNAIALINNVITLINDMIVLIDDAIALINNVIALINNEIALINNASRSIKTGCDAINNAAVQKIKNHRETQFSWGSIDLRKPHSFVDPRVSLTQIRFHGLKLKSILNKLPCY
jgi:hypothetical protein